MKKRSSNASKAKKIQSHGGVTPSGDLYYTSVIGPQESLGTRGEMIHALNFRMAKLREKSSREWIGNLAATRRKRKSLLENLHYDPAPVPLKPELISQQKFDGFVRKQYLLQLNPDEKVQAVLLLPDDATPTKKVPALLALHEHGGQYLLGWEKLCSLPKNSVFQEYQNRCYGGQIPADFLARNGFAVLAIDQMGFGSRALWRNHAEYQGRHKLSVDDELELRLRMRHDHFWLHRALLTHGITEADIALYDNLRSLDFLQTIPQIDSSRIGAFGLSVGSWWTHQIAALDERIKASVRICWSADMGDVLDRDGSRVLGVHFQLPGMLSELHVPQWIALSDPAAALVINGKSDPMYSYENAEKTRRQVMAIARRQKREDRVRWSFFDGGHCFYPPQQNEALQFFREFL